MKKTIYSLAAAVLASSFAFAQDSTKTGKFTISGYMDSYYQTAFNNPIGNRAAGASGAARAFDKVANQFALGLVQTKFMYTNRNSEMVIDLVFGPNAALGNFGHVVGLTGYENKVSSGDYTNGTYLASMAIKQAYFKYNVTSKFSFTVGQFGTHIGYEVIDAPLNYNYSLSNLFNNGPFYHVGAKLNYAFSDKFGLMLGVVNNWDNLYDWKKQKSIVAQLFISPIKGWNVYANYIGGYGDDQYKIPGVAVADQSANPLNNAATNPVSAIFANGYVRNLLDLTTGYQITSKFYFGANAALGWYNGLTGATDLAGNSTNYQTWYGAAVYTNYQFTSYLGLGLRYEHFADKYALRYIGFGKAVINNSFTATMPITLADGHVILKPEFRVDASPGNMLYQDNVGSGREHQATIGMAFIYKY